MSRKIVRYFHIVVWVLYIALCCIGISFVIYTLSRPYSPLTGFLDKLMLFTGLLILAGLLLLLHSMLTLGYRRGPLLLLISFLVGLLFEIIGVNWGTTFGGPYVYQSQNQVLILGVPLIIPLFWAGIIYTCYTISSSFLCWLEKPKPDKQSRNWKTLVLLVLLDALIIISIDLIMDPLQVHAGNWAWTSSGQYFDVPLSNFVGWFVITIISTGLFRTFEYHFPRRDRPWNTSFLLIPISGYGLLGVSLICFAVKVNLFVPALIAALTIFPVLAVNLWLYFRWSTAALRPDS
jgi:uncharacterized membrane protein